MIVRPQSIPGVLAACAALSVVSCFGQLHGSEATSEAANEFLREPAVATASDEITELSPQIVSFLQEPVVDDAESMVTSILEARSRWQTRVGALFLNRSSVRRYGFSNLFPFSIYSTPSLIYNAADFNFPSAVSVDTSVRYTAVWSDIDFRYFGVLQATSAVGPFSAIYAGNFGMSSSVAHFTASLESSLQSAELNLRREVVPNVALLAGFRYVQFRESLISSQEVIYGSQGSVTTMGLDWRAQNELFGLQVGAEGLLLSYADRLRIEAAAKAGVYGNAASSSLFFEYQGSSFTSGNYWNAFRGNAAFVGDVNLTATFQFTRHVALRTGYQLLWLSGVASGTEQLQTLSAQTFGTYSSSEILFHGALVGVECNW